MLLHVIEHSSKPLRWPIISKSIPERTGKQCRERYLNHLKPKLKVEEWSPIEDALIFHLHRSCGSKWAKMSKILQGRTDNGIKNRFHNIRRREEKEEKRRGRKGRKRQNEAADSVGDEGAPNFGYTFGPFRLAKAEGETCDRCHLVIPSLQTGRTMCERTGWCQACTRIPAYVSGNMLRECLNLRRSQDAEVDAASSTDSGTSTDSGSVVPV